MNPRLDVLIPPDTAWFTVPVSDDVIVRTDLNDTPYLSTLSLSR